MAGCISCWVLAAGFAIALFALSGCGSGGESEPMPVQRFLIVPLTQTGTGEIFMAATINGVPVTCLFDTGAGAPQDALWVQDRWAKNNGIQLQRLDSDFHYTNLAQVVTGEFSRDDVFAYTFGADWYELPCLIGLSFFKGAKSFQIDLSTNELRIEI